MVLTRATNDPGPDGILGTADDIHEHENTTSPFVDQNQTYTSHPSHQVFLRAYELRAGEPVATGKLITNRDLGADGHFGAPARRRRDRRHGDLGGGQGPGARPARHQSRPTMTSSTCRCWPTDPYGNFIPGPHGFPQVVMAGRPTASPARADDGLLVEGNPALTDRSAPTRVAHRPSVPDRHCAFAVPFDHPRHPPLR